MKIRLLVDDLRSAPNSTWTVARTITEAIRILATQDVEEVLLDHDINQTMSIRKMVDLLKGVCGFVTVRDLPQAIKTAYDMDLTIPTADKYSEETYEPVARYIALMPDPPKVDFITANPAGRERMKDILVAGGKFRRSQSGRFERV